MQSHPLQESVSLILFQVMQVSQVHLASQEHLEVRGQTIMALILRRNADILVETFGKTTLTFTSVGANPILVGFVFKSSFCTACLKSENLRIYSFILPAYWEYFKPEFYLCVD